jgi:hypothetical protein
VCGGSTKRLGAHAEPPYCLLSQNGTRQSSNRSGGCMDTKQDAYEFLAGLQKDLDGQLPGPMEIRAAISARWDKPPKERNTEDQLACRENVFLYHSVLPILSSYMGAFSGMDADKIRADSTQVEA